MTPSSEAPDKTALANLDDELVAEDFRPGTPGCHELLDRTSLLSDMVERYLLDHPACSSNPGWHALAEQAAASLRELYQQVGAEHLSADETGSAD